MSLALCDLTGEAHLKPQDKILIYQVNVTPESVDSIINAKKPAW